MTRAHRLGTPASLESAARSDSRYLGENPRHLPVAASPPVADSPVAAALRVAAASVPHAASRPEEPLSRRGRAPDEKHRPDRSDAGNRIVPDLPTRFVPYAVAAFLSAVLLLGGCQERLAQRDSYFAPLNGLSVSLHSETEHVLDYHQALQAAMHGCSERPGAESPGVMEGGTPVSEGVFDPGAQSRICASSGVTHAAHGAPLNGYQRWVGDQVRELPSPSETASSIGGGS